MTRKSCLIVTRNLPPLQGGIERLLRQAVAALAVDFDLEVVGPAGCGAYLPDGVRVREVPPGLPRFFPAALLAVLGSRLGRRHDLCIGGSGLVAPLAALAALLHGCPRVLFVHGLDLVAPYRLYRWLFLPWIRRADRLVANSAMTARLAADAGVAPGRIVVLNPGVAVRAAAPPVRASGTQARLLAVGRLVARKGLAEFVGQALPRIRAALPDALLEIVGAEPPGAAAGGGTRDRVLDAARRAGVADAVRLLGAVDDDALARRYREASVLVFPCLALPGDVEGFGMVVVEAAAHGLPAVAFDVGGVADAMSADNGILVPPQDYAGFADAVVRIARGGGGITPDSCRRHALRYDWSEFGAKLRRIAGDVIAAGHAAVARPA